MCVVEYDGAVSAWSVGLFTECYRPIQNGIVASVDALAQTLCAHGHDVTIVAPRMPRFDDAAAGVVRIPSLPLPTRTAYRLTVPYLPRIPRPLSIVHAHSPFVTGALAVAYARRCNLPLVFTYHTQLEAYAHYIPFESNVTRAAAKLLTRSYANAADAVVVPTRAMEEQLRAIGVERPIAVVPSGIDVATFARGRRSDALRARLGIESHERIILAVGRLGREKNVELALQAFARVTAPDVRLVVVGDGTHRRALERTAQRLGIAARTMFAREFARETLPDAYASADVFLFTSRSETQGLVLIEALAAGASVVAVDTPQTREVLAGAGTVAADNAEALAIALDRSLANGSNADEAARARAWDYDARDCASGIMALYATLIERPSLHARRARTGRPQPV